MKYLADANVLSETTRSAPSRRVADWLVRHEAEIVVDPIVLGEIRFGILLMEKGRRREKLEGWFENVVAAIRCLAWDAAVGRRWAELQVSLRNAGLAMPSQDSMIAATALAHDLIVATRNTRDFTKAGVRIVNPFE